MSSLPPSRRRASVSRLISAIPPAPETTAPWIPDRGDGTYRNPILYADYSKPDAIRVGQDYWLTSSSFNQVPGLPILHSRDLVNWTLVNHALPADALPDHFAAPRPGLGVGAPSLRYHAGVFWIFYADPDFGIYVISSDHPSHVWSKPTLIKRGRGLIDPCPLWDNDGRAYLIHGWPDDQADRSNQLTLHQLSPDALKIIDEGMVIIDGGQLPGWKQLKGPKLYKHFGYYFVFAAAIGTVHGYQAVFRSRNIYGPYQWRIVLEQGSTSINEPHEGAWVDTPAGEHWFLHFQEMAAYGGVVHLQPLHWQRDRWPSVGQVVNGKGEPVLVHAKPALPPNLPTAPLSSDDFQEAQIGLQWQWQAKPLGEWARLSGAPGGLQLRCVPLATEDNHWTAGHLLLQKFCAPEFVATTHLRFSPQQPGDVAGLIVFGYSYAWIGLRQNENIPQLLFATSPFFQPGRCEQIMATVDLHRPETCLQLTVREGGNCQFSYSVDGKNFRLCGPEFIAASDHGLGPKFGLFASTTPATLESGHAEFSWFRVGS